MGKTERQGRKWAVEEYEGDSSIKVTAENQTQSVYIYKCKDSVVQIEGKTTNVTLDNCQGVGVVLADCIASVDVVNCKKVQVQVTGQTPTVSFDKTSGAMLFITRAAKDSTTIVTSMSTEINVTLPGATENDDATEIPIAEQFVSNFKGDTLVTAPTSHI